MKKIIFILAATLGTFLLSFNARAQVEVGITITAGIPPPPLPYYEQPYCPADGYLWTPGYWAFEDGDYYWVPGVWVLPPQPGYYWTPCYWAYTGGVYGWHQGYWGPHIGFYGGVDYGYGYYGSGFTGGRWDQGRFRYNTAVLRVNTRVVHNVYVDRTVVVNDNRTTRISYNGGNGGIAARP
ncbi:MAG TPA: YXWGXW repeat-containing protein, partial [Puia sp.]|nr:YXWGXW repeat-containing protein [Puia sp.]